METTKPLDIRPSSAPLWTGILAGPFAFGVAFETKYALLAWICDHKAEWIFWAITIIALLICAFGAFESWRGGRGADSKRIRFMSISGLSLNAAFAMFIIAMAIPHLYLGACE
jgi:uncharacterized membrane protein